MKAIGYQEFIEGMSTGELDMRAIKEKIVINSIHYAKRQKVFFQSFSDVDWVNPAEEDLIRQKVSAFLNE